MTRMTGPDCAVMCNFKNIHLYIHTYIYTRNVTSEPLDAQGQIPEKENRFEEATVKAVTHKDGMELSHS